MDGFIEKSLIMSGFHLSVLTFILMGFFPNMSKNARGTTLKKSHVSIREFEFLMVHIKRRKFQYKGSSNPLNEGSSKISNNKFEVLGNIHDMENENEVKEKPLKISLHLEGGLDPFKVDIEINAL